MLENKIVQGNFLTRTAGKAPVQSGILQFDFKISVRY